MVLSHFVFKLLAEAEMIGNLNLCLELKHEKCEIGSLIITYFTFQEQGSSLVLFLELLSQKGTGLGKKPPRMPQVDGKKTSSDFKVIKI